MLQFVCAQLQFEGHDMESFLMVHQGTYSDLSSLADIGLACLRHLSAESP